MGPTRRSKPRSSSSRLRRLRREHLRPLPRLRSSWLPRSLWPRQRRSRGRRAVPASASVLPLTSTGGDAYAHIAAAVGGVLANLRARIS
jgi:hypothetical protein